MNSNIIIATKLKDGREHVRAGDGTADQRKVQERLRLAQILDNQM